MNAAINGDFPTWKLDVHYKKNEYMSVYAKKKKIQISLGKYLGS